MYDSISFFFGGYLHQDWRDQYPTVELAVQNFASECPEMICDATQDIENLLMDEKLQSDPIRMLHDLDCYYNPGFANQTAAEWLSELGQLFRELVKQHDSATSARAHSRATSE